MMRKALPAVLALLIVLTGCSTLPGAAPEETPTPVVAIPLPSLEPTLETAPSPTAACPNPDCVVTTPQQATLEPLVFLLPTPGNEPRSAWRPPLYPVPWSLSQYDHFYLTRPIAADNVNWPLANYRYGGVFFENVTHTGVDIPASPGTPVIAAGAGTVIWAGYGLFSLTPENLQDPYGIAVAIRHDFGYLGEPVFTLYAHLQEADVAVGQWVNVGEQLGKSGSTGVTTGPHLHFEVRLGENSYYRTRNPELWIAPPQGWGVLAGRIMESNRTPIQKLPILIRSLETGREWTVYTYGPEAVVPDPYYNENMVIGDLPSGKYRVTVPYTDGNKSTDVEILAGRITYISFRGTFGFSATPPPTPGLDSLTPAP